MTTITKRTVVLTSIFGITLIVLGFYFTFFLWTSSIFNLDLNDLNLHFEYLIIGCTLIGAGMFIFTFPLQRYLGKWGIKKSFDIAGQMVNVLAQGSNIRMCMKCGRKIPFDANLCPYCGYDFR